jgi:hypothetical protein
MGARPCSFRETRQIKPVYTNQTTYNTRRSTVTWFSTNQFSHGGTPPPNVSYASIDIDPLFDDQIFSVSISQNAMPTSPPLHQKRGEAYIVSIRDALEPHSFYKQLLQWDSSLIAPQVPSIADAIVNGGLHVCADGAYMPDLHQGAQAWAFSTTEQTILWKNVGPLLASPLL